MFNVCFLAKGEERTNLKDIMIFPTESDIPLLALILILVLNLWMKRDFLLYPLAA